MAVKYESNLVGSLMFVLFLMGSVAKYTFDAIVVMISIKVKRDLIEAVLVFPTSLGVLIFLGWVFFDSSWLNYDDEEKDSHWKTSRWIKFLVIFALPIMKLFTNACTDTSNLSEWGREVSRVVLDLLVFILAYLSLCFPYNSGLGRLFQPFTVPRSRVYTDEKGQKFEVNFIGTTLSILLIVLPCWKSLAEPLGRTFLFITGNSTAAPTGKVVSDAKTVLSSSPEGRAIADAVLILLFLYTFLVIFFSCVKVTFFLKGSHNNLKFAPITLTPLAILFTDQLCDYSVVRYKAPEWITMLCYAIISLVAYISLVSPPDSLTAVLFQPHIPMIDIIKDLPNAKAGASIERPRSAVVFPDEQVPK